MFNRKKRNHPGLYGKFQHIDLSKKDKPNTKKPEHREATDDYSTDEDLASLENLVKRLKHKAKQDPQEHKYSQTFDESEHDYTPPLNSQHAVSRDETDDVMYGSLLTSSSYIDNLEQDLLQSGSIDASDSQVAAIEQVLKDLQVRIARLAEHDREKLFTGKTFDDFMRTFNSEKDISHEQ